MNSQEFKEFCRKEFIKRGFVKKKDMFYLHGNNILCGMRLKKSNYGPCYYVQYNFFIGKHDDSTHYPTHHEADIRLCILVLSKDTINGRRFMDGLIEYEKYDADELRTYFDHAFEKYILPPVLKDVEILLENQKHYFASVFPQDRDRVMTKILEALNVSSDMLN